MKIIHDLKITFSNSFLFHLQKSKLEPESLFQLMLYIPDVIFLGTKHLLQKACLFHHEPYICTYYFFPNRYLKLLQHSSSLQCFIVCYIIVHQLLHIFEPPVSYAVNSDGRLASSTQPHPQQFWQRSGLPSLHGLLYLRNTIAVGGHGEDTRLKQQVVAAAEPAAQS